MTISEFLATPREELLMHPMMGVPGGILSLDALEKILPRIESLTSYQKEYVLYAYDLLGQNPPLELIQAFILGPDRGLRLVCLQRLHRYPPLPENVIAAVKRIRDEASDGIEHGIAQKALDDYEEQQRENTRVRPADGN